MEHGLVIKGQKYHCPYCGSENVIYDKKEDPKLEEINKKSFSYIFLLCIIDILFYRNQDK